MNKMYKVFIDGSAGTTGLRIKYRLSARKDISLIILPEEIRKSDNARKQAINSADIVFLCLPDVAAVDAVSMVENDKTVIIDTSTAHRVSDGWAYGFPELEGYRESIRSSRFIANPGCHASGFISLVKPLTDEGIISSDEQLSCFSLTGYSGGGKKMIAEYESAGRDVLLDAPRMYGLSQMHKHIPEMVKICGLEKPPVFCPVVAPYYSGMEVVVELSAENLKGNKEDIKNIYRAYYEKEKLVRFAEENDENGFLSAGAFSGRDDMQVSVMGNEERILLVSRFDNLGKGASGSAIQNMNIKMNIDEAEGLVLGE